MSLKPVYVLPPEPDSRMRISRRAFGGVLLGAASAGALAGGWVGASLFGADHADRGDEAATSAPSNPHLDWVRGFDGKPVDPVFDQAATLLFVIGQHPDDPTVQRVARRVALSLCERPTRPNAALIARTLVGVARSNRGFALDESVISQLERIGRR